MKTYSLKEKDISQKWLLIDAENVIMGRLASHIAILLRGKHKTGFTPHMDCGDKIIVINADKIVLTGRKKDPKDGKIYYRHTGFPGGIKDTTAGKILSGKYPERVLMLAVQRMLTRNNLGREQMRNLHVYAGSEHPHAGQQPENYDFASKNCKNKKQ